MEADESKKVNSDSKMVKEIEDPFGGEKTAIDEINIDLTETDDPKSESHFVEDDGEDLPENFFDDFSNNDFMAGLELVDDWNDESESIEDNKKSDQDKRRDRSRDRARYDHRSRRRYSREDDRARDHARRRSRSREPRNRSRNRSRDRSREPRDRSREPRDRSKDRRRDPKPRTKRSPKLSTTDNPDDLNISEGNSEDRGVDRRRDPEKTKRDIQRDKIRCAKDQEARVFQEQLKVAETGLVPPGTELDVVLKSDKFKEGEKENEKKKEESEKKQKTDDLKKEKAEKRKASPRPRNPRRKTHREISLSPKRRLRDYSPSPTRDRDRRTRRSSREFDLRYHLREKRERYMKQMSPVVDRFSRSPSEFVMSPEPKRETLREKVIRSHNKHIRNRYSRSCSPISSNSLSDRDRGGSPRRRAKKFSFMEELQIKLCNKPPSNIINEIPQNYGMVPAPNMMCSPMPTPAPHDFFPQPLMSLPFPPNPQLLMGPGPSMCPPPDPFQHSLMMGSPDPNMLPHLMNMSHPPPLMHMPHHLMPPNMQQCLSPFPGPQVSTPPVIYPEPNQNMNNMHMYGPPPNMENDVKGNEELEKLFEDKKISLSDFLSVSAKPIDPTTTAISIHNKIKVISRCQEAMRMLDDPKLTGRFFPKIVNQPIDFEKRANEKTIPNQSPIRKVVVVRFNFTVPNKRGAKPVHQPSASVYLYKILSLLGLAASTRAQPTPKPASPKPISAPVPVPKPVPPPVPAIKKSNAFMQTDPVKCENCEARNQIKYTTRHTQTAEKTTMEVSTQVSVEDLNKSCTTFIPRGILKNSSLVQSISHLTPAQLLAQLEKEKNEDMGNKPWSTTPKKDFPPSRGFSDSYEPNPRSAMGSSDRFNDKFNDYRNINPFSDSYTGESSMYGSSNSQLKSDRFSNSYSMKPFSGAPSDDFQVRAMKPFSGASSDDFQGRSMKPFSGATSDDFQGRTSRFGPATGEQRSFESRRFPDSNIGPSFSSWNMPGGGRGNPRGNFMGNNMTSKFFGQRGPN